MALSLSLGSGKSGNIFVREFVNWYEDISWTRHPVEFGVKHWLYGQVKAS